jgi:hypothetical protein
MNKFNNVGYGIPTLGRKLHAFTMYARRQRNLAALSLCPGGAELVRAINNLVWAFDAFVSENETLVGNSDRKKGDGDGT